MNLQDQIKTVIAYDKDFNEILKIEDAKLTACEVMQELSKAANSLGTTIAEFTQAMQIMASFTGAKFQITARPETVDNTEIPNEKSDLKILDPIPEEEAKAIILFDPPEKPIKLVYEGEVILKDINPDNPFEIGIIENNIKF